ncbi:hypothetical protein FSP39_011068 [Pinctada imbricata]|uniref:B box-type domain-containing protein n=1 Tax=Pinctada imbricata TaxID=66713 RepID=A0AA89BZ88_PINIB|nr:hypothetical protein FSP39_011068 [Pinctada imbricata]
MASKSRGNSVTTCDSHAPKEIDRYCVECDVLGCIKCMDKHSGHNVKKCDEVADQMKYRFSLNLEDSRYTWLPLLEDKRNRLLTENGVENTVPETLMNGFSSKQGFRDDKPRPMTATELEREVDKKANEMIAAIEGYRKKLKKQIRFYQTEKKKNKQKDNNGEIDFDITYLKSLISDCESVYKSGTPVDIIRTNQTLQEVLRRFEINYSKSFDDLYYFRNRKCDSRALEYMFGSIEEVESSNSGQLRYIEAALQAKYIFGDDDIRLCAINENEAWISDNGDTMHCLVHKNGYSTKEVDFEFCTQSFSKSPVCEDVFVVDYTDKWVKKLHPNGVLLDLFRTEPFFPVSICVNASGNLFLLLTDSPIGYDGERHDFISEVSKHGHEMRKLEFDSSHHFTFLRNIDVGTNGDIIVIDVIASVEGRVCTLSEDGELKHCYNGSSKLDVEFNPVQTCCDDRGRILVTDVNNDVIHLLNQDAELLQLLFVDEESFCSPLSISVFKTTLWIGCKNGRVVLADYQNLQHFLVLKSVLPLGNK